MINFVKTSIDKMEFIVTLKDRNALLFWFGLLNLITAVVLLLFSFIKPVEFAGTNAWHKPIKFAISTSILALSIAWYSGYLPSNISINPVNWIIVITLAFEVLYITW